MLQRMVLAGTSFCCHQMLHPSLGSWLCDTLPLHAAGHGILTLCFAGTPGTFLSNRKNSIWMMERLQTVPYHCRAFFVSLDMHVKKVL